MNDNVEFHGFMYVVRAKRQGFCLLKGEAERVMGEISPDEAILTSLFGSGNFTPLAQCKTDKETGLCEILVGTQVEPIPHPDVSTFKVGELVAVRATEEEIKRLGIDGKPYTFGLN